MDSVNMDNNVISVKPKQRKYMSPKKKKLLFFFLMAAPFLIQAAIFYVYLNGSTVIMAFLEYHLDVNQGDVSTFVWFKNFGTVIQRIFSPQEASMFLVSFIMYAFVLCIVTPVIIFFSFYIYKRFFLSGFFRVILYMPQIISSVLYVMIYKLMLGKIYTQLTGQPDLLKGDFVTVMFALIFYTFWTGFGTNILLMSGAMSAIDDSVVEASYLDGCNLTKEFIHVTLPSIYPTITTFVVLDLTTIFSNSMHMFTFWDQAAPVKSVGYFMELHMLKSQGLYYWTASGTAENFLLYPHLAAMGLMITLTISPLAILVRKVMEKVGPSED